MKPLNTPSGAPGVKKNKTMNDYSIGSKTVGFNPSNKPDLGNGKFNARGGNKASRGLDYKVE